MGSKKRGREKKKVDRLRDREVLHLICIDTDMDINQKLLKRNQAGFICRWYVYPPRTPKDSMDNLLNIAR